MICGVGLDLCEVARIADSCRSQGFISRVFTDRERDYGLGKAAYYDHLAGAFAAKEAFAKATGLGLSKIGLRNVGVVHDESGAPRLWFNDLIPILAPYVNCQFHLSISHDGGFAAAVVICEKDGGACDERTSRFA